MIHYFVTQTYFIYNHKGTATGQYSNEYYVISDDNLQAQKLVEEYCTKNIMPLALNHPEYEFHKVYESLQTAETLIKWLKHHKILPR